MQDANELYRRAFVYSNSTQRSRRRCILRLLAFSVFLARGFLARGLRRRNRRLSDLLVSVGIHVTPADLGALDFAMPPVICEHRQSNIAAHRSPVVF